MGNGQTHRWIAVAIVFAATAIAVLVIALSPPLRTEADWSRAYRCRANDVEPPPGALSCPQQALDKDALDHARKVLETRLERYESDLGQMRTLLWLQLLAVILSIYVVWIGPKELKVPVLDIPVPQRWLHVALPIALLYLTVALGYLFDHVIQERYFLWLQTIAVEGGKGISIDSYGPLIDDRWVMDIWFSEFHPSVMAVPGTGASVHAVRDVLLFGFGAFVAVQYVCIFALIDRTKFAAGKLGATLWGACFGCALAVLVLDNIAFWLVGGNRNWVQWLPIAGLSNAGYIAWVVIASRRGGRASR